MTTSDARPTPPTIAILGGTGGIGSALAREVTGSGGRVALAARDTERLDDLAGQLGDSVVLTRSLDATDVDEVADFARQVAADADGLDGIANCVGSILIKPAHATSVDEWRRTLELNLTSAFATVRAAAQTMRRRGGSVVLFSSAAARAGLPSHEAIAAAKAGVIGLARSAAATYAPKSVRFNVVAPGLVDTPMAAAVTSNDMMRRASEAMHPLGRLGTAAEVARAAWWLLDPAQSWVTGQVLGVDGGLAAARVKASA